MGEGLTGGSSWTKLKRCIFFFHHVPGEGLKLWLGKVSVSKGIGQRFKYCPPGGNRECLGGN